MKTHVGKRIFRVGLAALLSVSVLAAVEGEGGSETEPADVPVARATTVVRATGHAGTRIEVPEGVRLHRSGINIEASQSAYSFAGLSEVDCIRANDLCINRRIYQFSALPPDSDSNARAGEDGEIRPGLYDVYILSDGNATLTLTFDGAAEGVLAVDAEGLVDATVQRLTPHCVEDPDQGEDCIDGAYGGATSSVTSPAYVSAVAYADRDSTGSAYAQSCLDPHFGTAPNGARDSNYGCPISPTDRSWQPAATANTVFGSIPTPNGAGIISIQTNQNPAGDVYAGFFAREQTPVGSATFAGFGFWLSGGIDFSGAS